MLTIDEVKNITFRKANLGGYRPEDVEAFIDEVASTLEQNRRDKIELVKKLDILAKRIEEYRKDEENVRGALLNAQKVMDSTVKEANKKAEEILNDAKRKAQDIIINANASIVNQKNNYLKLQADAVVLREQLLETYQSHIRMLEDLPTAAEITKTKAKLDEQYPVSADVAAAQPVLEKSVEQVVEKAEEKEEVVDISAAADEEEKEEKKDGKFQDLKFGENYSVTDK
ncbi:MAG: DivIVA domain-containing protein [Acutalibacteraceae bacterium]